jgi:NitT/TauT family transport system permease protein
VTKNVTKRRSGRLWSVLGVLIIVAFWELAALAVNTDLILPGPRAVFAALLGLLPQASFWRAVLGTLIRVILALLISVPLGIVAGFCIGLSKRLNLLLQPLMTLISATPVMALILILFLMLGTDRTPIFASFLVIFPIMANNTAAALRRTDRELLEVCLVYGVGFWGQVRVLYLPSIAPALAGGLSSAMAMAWKVVVAAEVLVQPLRAMGTGMQAAKSLLETPELFAWTLVTLALAALSRLLIPLPQPS